MAAIDPYLDPNSGILKNLLGIGTPQELARAEADLVNARTVQLGDAQFEALLPESRDETELKAIHHHLFQDIYPFAGKFRSIDMSRGTGEKFAPRAGISTNIAALSLQLSTKNYLCNLDADEFTQELVYFYSMLNWIHPFREGNGRAQRLFWSRVAHDAGWVLDWRTFNGDLNEASRLSRENADDSLLYAGFATMMSPKISASDKPK